jgi:formylglycine-generating enzyme required for sulfatase activity
MHGNLSEWCHDWHGDFENEASIADPYGPDEASNRVYRGDRRDGDAAYCRSSPRRACDPTLRSGTLGFRLALIPSVEPSKEGGAESECGESAAAEPALD